MAEKYHKQLYSHHGYTTTMTTDPTKASKTGAENIEWDLTDLYTGIDEAGLGGDLASIEKRAQSFRGKWNGRLDEISIPEFVTMIEEYENLVETFDRMGSYTNLLWSTDSENTEYGRLLQTVRETLSRANSHLIFVSTQLSHLSETRFSELLSAPELASRRHWLERVLEFKPYTLSEEVERALSAKSITARASWVRLHDEVANSQVFKFNGQELTLAAISKLSYEKDRETRKAATEALSAGLAEEARTHAFVFNTIIADCETNQRLRGYPSWISSRNLENEVSDESVQTLINAVVDRYDLVRRYYGVKQRLLGLDEFHDYDRNAVVGTETTTWTWEAARDLVIDAYTSFDPKAGEIAAMFFEKNWIHAPVRKGKRSGAYSAGTIASVHPYVFINFTGTARDVQTLAHELGHGIHQYLSRQQGPLLMDTPLTIAETASVFGEMITFKKLYEGATTDTERLALVMSKLDGMIATVFRQIALNRFEEAMHTTRRKQGELSLAQINEIWVRTQRDQFGDSIILSPGYELWWSYISHFIHTPGYVYAYAFGELLVLALYEIFKKDPEDFTPKYMQLLANGGSKCPKDLLTPFGIDINDPTFWSTGLNFIERFITEAERLAESSTAEQA